MFAHSNAFECIFSAFFVCCILEFVAFSCILDPLYLHSLLLHSSFSRCVHLDAFSDLLHFGYDAFYCIMMHSQSLLHVGAFVTWCIRNVDYFHALWRIVHRCIFMHSWRGAFTRIVMHVDSGAFLYSWILLHSHVSHLQMHFVSTARPKPIRSMLHASLWV